jgi:hypothetical protein
MKVTHKPLKGFLHAGGVLADALVPQQDAASIRTVFGPKAWDSQRNRFLHTTAGFKAQKHDVLFSLHIASVLSSPVLEGLLLVRSNSLEKHGIHDN